MPQADGARWPSTPGFIVHNDRTYPKLIRLFGELGVETQDSDMTMSSGATAAGWSTPGPRVRRGVLARPANLLRPRT